MRAKHDANKLRVGFGHLAKLDAQINARPLPSKITDLAAENFLGESNLILCRSNRNYRVRMHMVDMRIGHVAMQASIN